MTCYPAPMRLFLPLLALALLSSPADARRPKKPPAPAVTTTGTVLRIVDGDTMHVELDGTDTTLRLLGLDCPESRHVTKCGKWRPGLSCDAEVKLGKAATRRAKQLVPPRATDTVEPHGRDRYGRTLAYVRLPDGRDLGLELVREGVCAEVSNKYPHPRGEAYRAAAKR